MPALIHVLLLAPDSMSANFPQLAKEWLPPHATQPVDFSAGFAAAGAGAAAVAATFAPPPEFFATPG